MPPTTDNDFKPTETGAARGAPQSQLNPKVMREIQAGWETRVVRQSVANNSDLEHEGIIGKISFAPEGSLGDGSSDQIDYSIFWWTPDITNDLSKRGQQRAIAKMVAINEELYSSMVGDDKIDPLRAFNTFSAIREGKIHLNPVEQESFALIAQNSYLRRLDLTAFAQSLSFKDFDEFREAFQEFAKEALIVAGALADNPRFLQLVTGGGENIRRDLVLSALNRYSNSNPDELSDLEVGAAKILANSRNFQMDSISLDRLGREMGHQSFQDFVNFWTILSASVFKNDSATQA